MIYLKFTFKIWQHLHSMHQGSSSMDNLLNHNHYQGLLKAILPLGAQAEAVCYYHCYLFSFKKECITYGVILYWSATPTTKTIFFKVRDRVKKASFSGSSLDDVNKLFLDKFPGKYYIYSKVKITAIINASYLHYTILLQFTLKRKVYNLSLIVQCIPITYQILHTSLSISNIIISNINLIFRIPQRIPSSLQHHSSRIQSPIWTRWRWWHLLQLRIGNEAIREPPRRIGKEETRDGIYRNREREDSVSYGWITCEREDVYSKEDCQITELAWCYYSRIQCWRISSYKVYLFF